MAWMEFEQVTPAGDAVGPVMVNLDRVAYVRKLDAVTLIQFEDEDNYLHVARDYHDLAGILVPGR